MAIVKDIDITPEQRQLVCSIFATHLPDTEVWAYGSRVHWNATSSSDLDLVVFSSDTSGLANCRDAFAESSLPFRVDLFLWDKIPANFQNRIKQEYAILLQSERSDWNTKQLGCVTHWKSGGTPNKSIKEYWNGKIPWISAKNLKTDHITDSEIHISEEGLSRGSRLADKDEILILVRGSELFNRIPISFLKKPVAFNQDVKAIKANEELYPSFLFYWLKSKETFLKSKVESTGIGAGKLDTTFLQNIAISYPTISEQKRIAGILSAFDDKIELNRKMCKTLETMAEALFKSWFVDFEPVRAKIAAMKNGKESELAAMMSISGKTESQLAEIKTSHPDAYSELAHTASLFPSAMVESEQGKIPEGWQAVQLKDVTTQITARIGERKCQVLSAVNSGELVLSVEHFNKQVFSKETNKYIIVKPNTYAYNPSRINIGPLGRNKFDFAGCVSPIYVVFSVAEEYISFFDQFFASQTFKNEVLLRASGSVRQALNYSDFGQIALQCPPLSIMQAFNEKIDIILQKLSALSVEIQTLSNLRDNHLAEFFSISEENEL